MNKLNNNKIVMRGDVYFGTGRKFMLFRRIFSYFDAKSIVSGFRITLSK